MINIKKLKTINGPIQIKHQKNIVINGNNCLGAFNLEHFHILLKKGMNNNITKQTIMHELIHSIESPHEMGLKETNIDILATAILYIIKNNPEFVKFLQGNDHGKTKTNRKNNRSKRH